VVTRVFRDVLTEDVTEIIIDDPIGAPPRIPARNIAGIGKKLKLYSGRSALPPLLEQQMERLFNCKVNLKNGSIVIEQTEQVAIDANTGGFREKATRRYDPADHLEAAREIARQLRLRDIGGLVMTISSTWRLREPPRRSELKSHLRATRPRSTCCRSVRRGQ
jgi:Rne/Rng family ribonuclease